MAAGVRVTVTLDKRIYLKFKRMAKLHHCSVPDLLKLMIKISWNFFVYQLSDIGVLTDQECYLLKN